MTLTDKNGQIATCKRIPRGWRVLEGATTAPLGCVWISNGKSFFSKDHLQKLLIVDADLYKQSKHYKQGRQHDAR